MENGSYALFGTSIIISTEKYFLKIQREVRGNSAKMLSTKICVNPYPFQLILPNIQGLLIKNAVEPFFTIL